MLSSRSIRVLISIVGIFGIIAFFLTTKNALGDSIQKAKPSQQSGTAVNYVEEQANTLQGKPHQGKEPPYAVDSGKGKAKGPAAQKIVADKTGVKSGDVHADLGGSDSITNPPPSYGGGGYEADSGSDSGAALTKEPIKSSKPAKCDERSFVVMIDAGSTGSRVHVYEFNTCFAPPKLLNEKFKMTEPGLSSFDTDTVGAAKSLDPLLKEALDTVPEKSRSCTPIAVKATAGLRKLGTEKSNKILTEVRRYLESDYPFAVVPGDGVSIMDGKDEGVYAWVTTNFLLGNIGGKEKLPTAAVFDLGGGSTQIVFEPEFGENEQMVDGEHKYTLNYGKEKYVLYQFSHLGFGLMEGRNKINSIVVEESLKSNQELSDAKHDTKEAAEKAKAGVTLTNPCVAPGLEAKDVIVETSKGFYTVNMKGPSSASGFECRYFAELALQKDAECAQKPCSFNGVHQPSLTKTFRKTSDMYIFSFFYDRTVPLGFPSSFSVEELLELSKLVCSGSKMWDVFLDEKAKKLGEEPQWCLDLSFITALLHTGYDIPLNRELRTVKKIDDNEVGWCLGASLPLLDKTASGWKCKIDESK